MCVLGYGWPWIAVTHFAQNCGLYYLGCHFLQKHFFQDQQKSAEASGRQLLLNDNNLLPNTVQSMKRRLTVFQPYRSQLARFAQVLLKEC